MIQPSEISISGNELFQNLDHELLVRSELTPSVYDVPSNTTFQEAIFVDSKVYGIETLSIGIVYHSPNSTKENSEELNNLINKNRSAEPEPLSSLNLKLTDRQ